MNQNHPATKYHPERHYSQRIGWLRAAVLGANDGIVSTASLIVGFAAAASSKDGTLLAGVAGLMAGAMSMAAGEYVSVSSQADTEQADLQREQSELEHNAEYEHGELTRIYIQRGLDSDLAHRVATQLMAKDALAAHARDELGLSDIHQARPIQAALTSALSFATGAALPLMLTLLSSQGAIIVSVSLGSLLSLAALGLIAARAGGAPLLKAAFRVSFWGALAMLATAITGHLFGAIL